MSPAVFTLKISGPAGAGIKSSGLLLSSILIRHGYYTADYTEYPSLIRGGHNTYQVSFSTAKVFAAHSEIDVLFSLEPGHWSKHTSEFSQKTLIFGDDTKNILPLKSLAADIGGSVYKNTICLGVAAYLLDLDPKICQALIAAQYNHDVLNQKAFDTGYKYAADNFSKLKINLRSNIHDRRLKIYDGNEAFGWGFIRGGGDFYAAYPMSPSSGTLHFLAASQEKYGIRVIHPEDEIAAASLCAGAAFAGARPATGTSGGGFALMTETVSLCGAAGLGVVFYLVSRPGPATGLPTWTSQGDLLFAVNSGHGEFNKIVLAPGGPTESFEMGVAALNLAARFNLPVIVLSDKFAAESAVSVPVFPKKVKIIKSVKPLPGTAGPEFMANSYVHDAGGFSVEDSDSVIKSIATSLAQLKKILTAVPEPVLHQPGRTAKKLIISFGSTSSTILEALKNVSGFDYLQIRTVWPLDPSIPKIIACYRHITVIENNSLSQLTQLLKSQFNFQPQAIHLKSDGRPFFPEELIKLLK